MVNTLALVLSGLAAGIASGGLGVGGAVVATPLIRLAGVSPYLAIGSTVPAILPGALTGAWSYFNAHFVDKKAVLAIAVPGALFSFAGAISTRSIDGHLLMLLTAAVLFTLAAKMMRPQAEPGPRHTQTESIKARVESRARGAGDFFALGAVAGFFSGLLGIGGGFLIVPVLHRWFHFPIKTALGTSLAILAVMAVPNMMGQAQAGNIDWRIALLLATGVIPGARIGAALAIRAPERGLRLTVGGALGLFALIYAGFEIAALSSSR